MSIESVVRACGSALSSARATERKKNGEDIKNFLNGNNVPTLLSENTIQNKGYTWNSLFDDISELVLKETEKYETSKNFDTVAGPFCTNLLHLCVSGSNKGQAYIKCDKIIQACLLILKDNRLMKAVGDGYLNLLYKHVLPYNYYLSNITPTAWEDLLEVCLSACSSRHSKLDNYTKLRLILLVMRSGHNYCQFVIPLRDSLVKLQKCFSKIVDDKKVQEVVIEIVILLLEALSTECRLLMCEFTEELMTTFLKFYDQNLDQKKKSCLFKLLHLVVVLHHPMGKTQAQNGSLAKSWSSWNKYLHSVLEVVCLEVAFIQKQKKLENLLKYYSEFYNLAASAYFQIFSMASSPREAESESSSKKLRVAFNRNKSFGDLVDELKQNHVPWLAIVCEYVHNNSQAVTNYEYVLLLRVLEPLVTSNSNVNWKAFEDLCCLAIKNVQVHFNNSNVKEVLLSMWNSILRTSTVVNEAHKHLHVIMQLFITLDNVNYQNVQQLFKMYYEKAMPVTDYSLTTLNHLIHKYYSKCSLLDQKIQLFNWLYHQQITAPDTSTVKDFLVRILATENIRFRNQKELFETTNHYDVIFNSIEKSMLFSEFELDLPKPLPSVDVAIEKIELNSDLNTEIKERFIKMLSEYNDKINRDEIKLIDYFKLVGVLLNYIDIMLKYNAITHFDIENENLFCLVKNAIKKCLSDVTKILKNDIGRIAYQIQLLECVKGILNEDYDTLLCREVRKIDRDFFQCINVIVNKKITVDDVIYEEDQSELDPQALRHVSICILAAYCRKSGANSRDQILNFILDPKIYNFTTAWDTNCAIDCMKLLNSNEVDDPPLESIFFLMQGMCKDLFKNPEATLKLLRVFVDMMDQFWQLEKEKQNCCIMVRGYLQRSGKKFYPPHVAAIIYECASKMTALDVTEMGNMFYEAVQSKTRDDIHSIRLFSCYLLKLFISRLPNHEISDYLSSLIEIFVVKVAEDAQEAIIRDESVNRTVTVLHNYLALVQSKNSWLHEVVTEVIQMQKEKSLDKDLVKKVLNKITSDVANKSVETYFNDNAILIVNYWLSKDNTVEELPLYLFGYHRIEKFLEIHFKWMIPAEVLWHKNGNVKDSEFIKLIQSRSGKTLESIVEACICNFIFLCLPYYVVDKYKLDFEPTGKREWPLNSLRMFEVTGVILGVKKWSTLFADNLCQLMIMITSHYKDPVEAKRRYNVNVPRELKSYQYPKKVFDAILRHMGELIEEDILNHLCENQALAIFKVLFHMWGNVLNEKVLEYKVLNLHSYVHFLEIVPLGQATDEFVCKFACTSLTSAIKSSRINKEVAVFVKGLRFVLDKILPDNVEHVRKCLLELLSILIIKKEEGFEIECASLLEFLSVDMKEYLKESEDVVDFISSMSQGSVFNYKCSSDIEYSERIKTYKNSLSCPSRETLKHFHDFLKKNKQYSTILCEELNTKGFSDDCGTSTIHQIICSLSNILKSATDDKTLIEACNCLSEIGNYDLKTLVTIPPPDTQRVLNIPPKQYFAVVVMTSLSEIIFDESPSVANAVSKTLTHLLQFKEGRFALELDQANKGMLLPLYSSNNGQYAEFKINGTKLEIVSDIEFWIPKADESHEEWLSRRTLALIELLMSKENYLTSLHAVCTSKRDVCLKLLAPLLGMLLECSTEDQSKLIAESLNNFFKHIWGIHFENRIENSDDSVDRRSSNGFDQNYKKIINYLLEIVNFVRLQRNHYKKRPERSVDCLNYLKLDYDKVALAATVADQNLAAIYYGELWAIQRNDGIPPSSPEATTQLAGGDNLQKIFRKCFVAIGEMNAIDGCGTDHLTSEDEKRRHLINTGQFADALLLHDIALSYNSCSDTQLQQGLVKSLHKSGMHHLALQYIKSLPENNELNDVKFECLSYLGDWSDFVDTRELEDKSNNVQCNPHSILKAYRYSCLKDCFNLKTTLDLNTKLSVPLDRAKRAVARLSQDLNMVNCQNVYKVISKLHLFSDIENYISVRCGNLPLKALLDSWQVNNLPTYSDFKHLEPLISQRSLFLEHAAKEYQDALQDVVSLQLQYAELSLSNERVQMAQRLVAMVKKVDASQSVALTDSQISWAKGHKDIALSLLRNIVSTTSPDVRLTAISLRQYGIWMAESKRDNPRDIINKYLKKSLEVLGNTDHEETRLKVYYDVAKFADSEYKQVVSYMNSSVFEKKVQCLENMKGTANSLRSTQDLSRDEKKALNVSDRFGQIDEAEIASTKAEKETFLQLAMKYYLLTLKECEANNLLVFRVISLWLDNPGVVLIDGVKFEDMIDPIPSRKFIAVLPQLAPRLTNDRSAFADNLRAIITRCAIEHPHHTLPILFSLKNSDKDKMILNASEKISQPPPRKQLREPRIVAAETLINKLADQHVALNNIIAQMDKLCDATISFANYMPQSKEVRQKIPSAELIHRLGPLDAIPIPTLTIPVSSSCNYTYLSTLLSFENYFELVGGINCPKKITCRSSDGGAKILLIKGQDDLRQDAVMQQVFNIVNTLLESDHVTRRNKLLIRTYKVVPMSRRSGVLEWCEGTMPIGNWLLGNGSGHNRYRSTTTSDISAMAARQHMKKFHDERRSNEEKLALFLKILEKFKPVFHFFFTEHFLDPVTWYERRLAYTKSVASSSMVGYILGLGDRHVQNILVDKNTAEVIHIDFGIAFDQGKTLPTPETIPFRLTQDIVAGFGSSGVEGIFRRSCEKTMQLLRDNQETLLTILEVLLCDPLYSWTVTSKQQNVLPRQSKNTSLNQTSGSDGSLAKRALLSVSSKLSGTEGGVAGGVAVPGQVARLIRCAMDPVNLSRLYPGWQPYL